MKQVLLLVNLCLPLIVNLPAVTPNNRKSIEATSQLNTLYIFTSLSVLPGFYLRYLSSKRRNKSWSLQRKIWQFLLYLSFYLSCFSFWCKTTIEKSKNVVYSGWCCIFILLLFLRLFLFSYQCSSSNNNKIYLVYRRKSCFSCCIFSPVPYTLFVLNTSAVALSSYLSWIIPTRIRYRRRPVCCVYQDKQDKDHRTRSYHQSLIRCFTEESVSTETDFT